MTAAKYDIEIDQGSDFALAITVSEDGDPRNLTNYDARAQLRPAVDSPDTEKTDFTFDMVNRADGIIVMKLTNTASSAMTAGSYVYDVEIFTDTVVTRILQGKAVIHPEVTK